MGKYRFEASIEWVRGGGKEHWKQGKIPVALFSPYHKWPNTPAARSDYCTHPFQLETMWALICINESFSIVLQHSFDDVKFFRADWEMALITLDSLEGKRNVYSFSCGNPGIPTWFHADNKKAVSYRYSGFDYYKYMP